MQIIILCFAACLINPGRLKILSTFHIIHHIIFIAGLNYTNAFRFSIGIFSIYIYLLRYLRL